MEHGPFIDGLPIEHGGSVHGYVTNNQMVVAYTVSYYIIQLLDLL